MPAGLSIAYLVGTTVWYGLTISKVRDHPQETKEVEGNRLYQDKRSIRFARFGELRW